MKQVHRAVSLLMLCSVPVWAQSSRVQTDITNPNTTAQRTTINVTRIGSMNLRQLQTVTPSGNSAQTGNFRIQQRPDFPKPINPRLAGLAGPVKISNLVVDGLPIVRPSGFGFDGIDARDSAIVAGFTSEPPDQGLGVSSSQVGEAVNDALAIYTPSGSLLAGPVSFENFFGVPPPPPGTFTELSDPRIFYDWESQRWFITILQFAFDTTTGNFLPGSQVLLAVSNTSDGAGSYTAYSIDVSDNSFPGCPCLGDQPLFGTNRDGVYISTNEFSQGGSGFRTALIVALDKDALVAGASSVNGVIFDNLSEAEGQAFSIQPALPAPNTSTSQNKGTEYFVSSLDFTGTVDNRLTVWALTDTSSLSSGGSGIGLHQRTIRTEEYGQPPNATQKPGPTPLGTSLGEPEELLATNDDRMNQVYYANGKLVTGLNTVILSNNGGAPRAGIAWFDLKPKSSFLSVSASVARQGYVAAENENVMFPAAALSSGGKGVIGFSLSGPDYFPSTAYVNFNNASIGNVIHLQGVGAAPEDGFSGYRAFGGNGVARWGDYSAAVISPGGHTWFAAEYITPRQRTTFTNWGTFISKTQ